MLQQLNVLLVVRGPKLNTVLQVQPHQCRVQGHDPLPTPAGHTIPDTSQDAIGLLSHLGTLLAHAQPAVDQHPKILFQWATLPQACRVAWGCCDPGAEPKVSFLEQMREIAAKPRVTGHCTQACAT